ncbi:MAG: hypothetical protein PHG02_07750 [Oscillospiraceae bacterium]|nr:hypothetical protein [Oscillospiraceae bacterium]
MKKIIFGVLLTITGLIFAAFSFIYAALNPWDYNGIGGLMGSFLGTQMLGPFIISVLILVIGLAIVGFEAYNKK